MPTVILSNLKGGVGKTTLADQVAFALESRGYDVGFYDLDGQGGPAHETSQEEHEWQVVDLPGRLDEDTFGTIEQADLVVVPYGADMLSYDPTSRYLEAIQRKAPGTKILHVLNAYDKSSPGEKRFRQNCPLPIDVVVPVSRTIKNAENTGEAIPKMYSWTPGAKAIEELTDKIIEMAGE